MPEYNPNDRLDSEALQDVQSSVIGAARQVADQAYGEGEDRYCRRKYYELPWLMQKIIRSLVTDVYPSEGQFDGKLDPSAEAVEDGISIGLAIGYTLVGSDLNKKYIYSDLFLPSIKAVTRDVAMVQRIPWESEEERVAEAQRMQLNKAKRLTDALKGTGRPVADLLEATVRSRLITGHTSGEPQRQLYLDSIGYPVSIARSILLSDAIRSQQEGPTGEGVEILKAMAEWRDMNIDDFNDAMFEEPTEN